MKVFKMGVDSVKERFINVTHGGLVFIVFDNQSNMIKMVPNETLAFSSGNLWEPDCR